MNTRSVFLASRHLGLAALAAFLICAPKPASAAGHFAAAGHGGFGFHGGAVRGFGGFRGGFGWRGGFYGWGWPAYGLFLGTLPFYYSTLWWDGVPYYYADNYYYVWNPAASAYQTVPPPSLANRGPMAPGSNELFAYPKSGQDEAQQARDKQECQAWAASQTGAGTAPQARGDNLRAQTACLEGRGYSVR
jgi:hypothetical protein